MDKLTVGRIVHIRIPVGDYFQCRPAIVVNPWSQDVFNGVMFTDGINDDRYQIRDREPGALTVWVTSVNQERLGGFEAGKWHWPERVD